VLAACCASEKLITERYIDYTWMHGWMDGGMDGRAKYTVDTVSLNAV